MTSSKTKYKPLYKKILRFTLRTLLILFFVFVVLVLFVRSPWGQDIIVGKVNDYVSDKINTEFNIGKLYVTFSGNVSLEELYLEDTSQDTLVYSKYLEANVPFRPLIFGNEIMVDLVDWRGFKANVHRKDSIEGFNYQFIIDAFASSEEEAPQPDQAEGSTEDSMQISIGRIAFKDFDLAYYDEVTGMDTSLILGSFEVESEEIDLENMKFHLSELSLKDTDISFSQFKPSPPSEDEEESKLPWILVDRFSIEGLSLAYSSKPDGIATDVYIDDFSFSDLDANLDSQEIALNTLFLKDSNVKLEMNSDSSVDSNEEEASQIKNANAPFTWPQWKVDIGEIDFENHKIEFYQNGQRPKKGEFNAEALSLHAFHFKLNGLHISKEESLSFDLNDLRFREESGLVLKEFKLKTRLNSEEIQIENLKFGLNNSSLFADLQLKYFNLDKLINAPSESDFKLDVRRVNVDVKDAYVFLPDLKENEQVQAIAQQNLQGSLKVNGNANILHLPKFELKWGEQTQLVLDGEFSNLTEVDDVGFILNNLKANSTRNDLSKFVPEEELGISLPEQVALAGDFEKNGNAYKAQSELKSSFGDILIDGFYNSTNFIDYKVSFNVNSLQLDQLLNDESLGGFSMQLNSTGKGETLDKLTAQLTSTIDSVRFNAYTFRNLSINGELEDGNGDVNLGYKDDNIDFDIVSLIELDSISPKVDLTFNLKGLKTQKLGLTTEDYRGKIQSTIQFEGNADQFQLDAKLTDGLVIFKNRPYYLGEFDLVSKVDSTMTKAKLTSPFLNGDFKADANIESVYNALQNHFKRYAQDTISLEDPERPVNFDLEMTFIETPIISNVFLDGLQQMDTLRASIHFHEDENELTSSIQLPYINYQDNEVEGLSFDVKSYGDKAEFNFGFVQVVAGPLDIPRTIIDGIFQDRILDMNLNAIVEDKDLFNSSLSIAFEEDELFRLKVSPKKLIINGSPWSITETNELLYQKDKLQVRDFKLSRNSQEVELRDDLDIEQQHFGVLFNNFRLSSITNYLNPNEKLAGGNLSGRLVLLDPFVNNGLLSDLTIEDLKLTEVPLGNLTLTAETISEDSYELNLALKDAGIDLDVGGLYKTIANESSLDFDVKLSKLEMQTIEKFATDVIKDSKGQLKGDLAISGSLDNLKYEGDLGFEEAEFNLKTLNTVFQLRDEKVNLNTNEVNFNKFTIRDIDGNTFTTDGYVFLYDMTNPEFDLKFNAKDFQLLNSTIEDNELYFGKLIFDADAVLNGDLNVPKVDLNLTIKETTDLNYIIPDSQASIEERDGVVVFVNRSNPDDILTKKDEEDFRAVVTGIDFKSDIKIEKASKVKVVLDKRTQDNVFIQGGGDFIFRMSRNGNMDLVGKYEVAKGSLELNLYNVVKRKFDIAPSSTVTWSGDPYDADLDLRAIYNISTSASALMATHTAGENMTTQNKYKEKLPFQVYMNVGGELMSPDLSFQLDMPEKSKGAINGSVYGKINQVNQQVDQLNKQVFSLLVLNQFYPESGSDGSSGGTASLARDNLNQALSDQLNTFSDKLTGDSGISLNFDVNSYKDYQGNSAQERTDVNVSAEKKLLDDRLVVEAGSSMNVEGSNRPGQSQVVLGNVSVEYLLTEDGRWKLRGFRKGEYENVIDGQVFVSGIALIFTREFNKFKVLWNKAYRESLEEKDTEVKSKKENENKEDDKN